MAATALHIKGVIMEMTKHIELPFKVIASYDTPDASVGYDGGIDIVDVTLDGQSVYTGDIQGVIEKHIRSLEPEIMEEVNEEMIANAEDEAAAKADWEYEMIKDRRMMEQIEKRYETTVKERGL